MAGSLFDTNIQGFSLIEGFVDDRSQASLIHEIEQCDLAPFRFQQWTGKRETASFGMHYDFTSSALQGAEGFPSWLDLVARRVEQVSLLANGEITHALLTRYSVGAGIGWHRDRRVFGDVFGISLGAEAILRFRLRTDSGFKRHSQFLPPGSLYRLQGEARNVWEHSIAPQQDFRWSITLRTMTARRMA